MKRDLSSIPFNPQLVDEIKAIVQEGRQQVAQAVNSGLTATYWQIGKRINEDILQYNRAEYGEQVVNNLSTQLVEDFGNGFSAKNLRRMMQFYEVFPDFQIVATLWRQLSWSHFKILIPLKSELERLQAGFLNRVFTMILKLWRIQGGPLRNEEKLRKPALCCFEWVKKNK